MKLDKARVRVDFNELVAENVVLVSQSDEVTDSEGNRLVLTEGLKISIYEYNDYVGGEIECLLADGIAEPNNPNINGEWTKATKWCCRIDDKGITQTSVKPKAQGPHLVVHANFKTLTLVL